MVFGLTLPRLELTIYRTRDEHANYYITNAVAKSVQDVPNVHASGKNFLHVWFEQHIIHKVLLSFQ